MKINKKVKGLIFIANSKERIPVEARIFTETFMCAKLFSIEAAGIRISVPVDQILSDIKK